MKDSLPAQESLLRSQTLIIPPGQSLLYKDPALRGASVLNWQGSWSTILHDVFHASIDILLEGPIGSHFATLLRSVSHLQRQDPRDINKDEEALRINLAWENHPVNLLLWAQ